MTYRQSNFDPGHAEPSGAPVRPYDGWQKLGLFAFVVGGLILALEIAALFGFPFDRDYPTLIFLALGGLALLYYRSTGGLLGGRSPAFRRNLGLLLTLVGLALAALEFVP